MRLCGCVGWTRSILTGVSELLQRASRTTSTRQIITCPNTETHLKRILDVSIGATRRPQVQKGLDEAAYVLILYTGRLVRPILVELIDVVQPGRPLKKASLCVLDIVMGEPCCAMLSACKLLVRILDDSAVNDKCSLFQHRTLTAFQAHIGFYSVQAVLA